MRKRIIQGGATAVALALIFTAAAMPGAHAAQAVDTERLCSVEFAIGGENEDLKNLSVPVRLYQVASISEAGTYTASPGFETLDLGFVKDGEASASTWLERAKTAAELCEGKKASAEGVIEGGSARLKGLETGLYLVAAEGVKSTNYAYEFSPYLISLPNNDYYRAGAAGDDTWVYDDVEIGLKSEQSIRLGDVRIDKELLSMNTSIGGKATFVFQVDVRTPKGETERKNVALTFDAAEQKSAWIKDVPAGSEVTVTEIYAGAGYQLVEGVEAAQTTVVLADDAVSVRFVNEQDGTMNGGYGVVNQFTINENNQYEWKKLDGNSSSQP